jgi:hypothetical protein
MRMQWDGVTPARYDEVRRTVKWDSDPAEGGLLHEAWFVGDQLNVCDVWETPDAFNTFVETRLMPGVAQVGIDGQPKVEILPVHNWQVERPLVPDAVVEEEEMPADAYLALEAEVGWKDVPPTGGISHVAARDGDIMRLVTAWEKEADHFTFEAERILPAAAALGFPEQDAPEPQFHHLHAVFNPSAQSPT